MAIRGLREKIQYVHNPLPNISDEDLLKRAGLEIIPGSPRAFLFSWVWRYDAGLNHEQVRLGPGDFVALREKEVQDFLAEFAEQGAVAVEDPEDVEELRKAKVKGLQAAQKFFLDRGVKRAANYRKVQGIGQGELDELKADHWPWYRNQVAADVIAEEIKRVRGGDEVETPRARKGKKTA